MLKGVLSGRTICSLMQKCRGFILEKKKKRMFSWLEKLTVDCWGWILCFLLPQKKIALCEAVQITNGVFLRCFSNCICVSLCGFFFFCRSIECYLLWQRPVETVVPFEDAEFSEMQSALKKMMPATP